MIDKSSSVSLRQLNNRTAVKNGGTSEGGVLVTQEKMPDADAAKVDTNKKADTPNVSDASKGSNIDTTNIDVKRGIRKPQDIACALYWIVFMRQQTLCDSQ